MWSVLQSFPLETTVGRAALVGLVLLLVGYISLVTGAFRGSRAWGILLIIFPLSVFRYCVRNWDESKKPALALILGLAMMMPFLGDSFRAERERRLDATRLGPEVFQDQETMAEMELIRTSGVTLADALGKRANLYEDLDNYVDEMSPLGPAGTTPPARPAPITHPDIPPDLDTPEKQHQVAQSLVAEQKDLERRRQSLVQGDEAAINAFRKEVLAYNTRANRHRKAVEAYRAITAKQAQPTAAVSPPVAAGQ